ncbi:hypothetical protein M8818_005111 [Zalaria obscura]|uniref:Uncharacterized protein n=1 Tax=Zalaria obscura TaxID=2024903 RepID=A0ACC3SAR0_9PEZI
MGFGPLDETDFQGPRAAGGSESLATIFEMGQHQQHRPLLQTDACLAGPFQILPTFLDALNGLVEGMQGRRTLGTPIIKCLIKQGGQRGDYCQAWVGSL